MAVPSTSDGVSTQASIVLPLALDAIASASAFFQRFREQQRRYCIGHRGEFHMCPHAPTRYRDMEKHSVYPNPPDGCTKLRLTGSASRHYHSVRSRFGFPCPTIATEHLYLVAFSCSVTTGRSRMSSSSFVVTEPHRARNVSLARSGPRPSGRPSP